MSELWAYRLGRVEYEDGLKLQRLFGEARRRELVPDVLLLLEHPPVLTLGRSAKTGNIVAPAPLLARMGVEVHETDRGGDVTYHGPGQIVGYPVFLLGPELQDVRKYVRSVEEGVIRALARFGLRAGRIPEWRGVWLGEKGSPDARKIAAIGVHLSRWLTSHGFALNVRTDLSHFRLIVPCGIREAGVTSMQRELGDRCPDQAEVERALAESYADVFGARLVFKGEDRMRTVSVAVTNARGEVLVGRRRPERGGFWQILTGRVEPGETPEQAAAREAREETGRELEVRPLGYVHSFALGDDVPPRLAEETAFAARWPEGPAPVCSEEHEELRWVSPAEAEQLLPFTGLKKAVRLALAGPPS